jgi:hypothetical protein
MYGLYRDYNVNTNIYVDLSNIILAGFSMQYYSIQNTITTTGNILPLLIFPIFKTNKYYDGTPNVYKISYTLSGILLGDTVTLTNIYGSYRDYNANTNIYVDLSNIILSGANSKNYVISFPLNSDSNLYFYYTFDIETLNDNLQIKNIATNNYDTYTLNTSCISTNSNVNNYSLYSLFSPVINTNYFTSKGTGGTLSLWINQHVIDNYEHVTSFLNTVNYSFALHFMNGGLYLKIFDGINTSDTLIVMRQNDIWYHVAIIFDTGNSNILCYVNNLLVTTIQKTIYIYADWIITGIGCTSAIVMNHIEITGLFNGYIDDYRFYDRVLQDYELTNLYLYKSSSIINNKQIIYGNIYQIPLYISFLNNTVVYTGYTYNNLNVTYTGLVNTDNLLTISNLIYATTQKNNYFIYNNSNFNPYIIVFIGHNPSSIKYTYTTNTNIIYSVSGIFTLSGNVLSTTGSNSLFVNGLFIASNDDYSMFVSGGSGTNTIAYSYDCIQWIGIGSSIFTTSCVFVTYINNMWLAGGTGTNTMAKSYDGITWTNIANGIFTTNVKTIVSDGNLIIAGGSGNSVIAYSYDAITWTTISVPNQITLCNSIATNTIIWLVATNIAIFYSYTMTDFTFALLKTINHIIWDENKFIACGHYTNIFYSYDGITWLNTTSVPLANYYNINYNGTEYLISSDSYILGSTDGITWAIKSDFPTNIRCVFRYSFIKNIKSNKIIDVGTYTILPYSKLKLQNYSINYSSGIITINKANLSIYNISQYKYYTGIPFTDFKPLYYGFLNNDLSKNLTGQIIYYITLNGNRYYDDIINIGDYYITLSGLQSNNYNITYNSYLLSIKKLNLTVISNNDIKIYDGSGYNFQPQICGIIYDSSYAFELINKPIINTGEYTNIMNTNMNFTNYYVNYYNGNLTVEKSPLFIIANNDYIYTYNTTNKYLLIYDPEYYTLILNEMYPTLQSLQNTYGLMRVWSLYGYQNACQLIFYRPNNLCGVGLSEVNYQTQSLNVNQYIINVYSSYFTITEYNNITNYNTTVSVNSIFKIIYNYPEITYYLDNTIIKTTNINTRQTLHINILTYYSDQHIIILNFNPLNYIYSGGNGFYCVGFKNNDNIYNSLSGSIIYSGNSQTATEVGVYNIIPSGFQSNNYNIQYIIGNLIIKKSIQN